MRKKSQAAKHGGNAELRKLCWGLLSETNSVYYGKNTEAAPESTMTASERPEGTNPSLKKSVIEEITLSESETDEDDELPTDHEKSLPPPDQENDWSELMMGEKKFEGKIDYIVKLLETHGHTLDSIKTEVTKRSFLMETVPTPDTKYKNMYIASQKKIEELAEENRVLTQKLENALDRFEAYKNGNRDAFEMLEKLKDVILISNGSRGSESTQATSQAGLDKVASPDAGEVPPSNKRKKLTRQN